MSNKLLPCPFCGNDKIEVYDGVDYFWLVCIECGIETDGAETRAKAIAAWNTRQQAQQTAYERNVLAAARTLRLQSRATAAYDDDYDEHALRRALCRAALQPEEAAHE
jgi:Lar family restriction alleviation protein